MATLILLSAFMISIVALLFFIIAMTKGWLDPGGRGAYVIFARDEVGRVEDPAATPQERNALQEESGKVPATDEAALEARADADRSTSTVTFVFLGCAVVWLVAGSLAGLTASLKMHWPDWLGAYEWLTFGRIRTLHLNIVAYGWTPMAGLGVAIWLLPRLLKTRLVGGNFALLGAILWNAGLIAGLGAIAVGFSDGMEWLEMPWQVDLLLVAGGALIAIPLILTLRARQAEHIYVSVWYMGAALFWFPVLYLVGNLPGVHFGVQQAATNWWFGHNVLGLFYTPIALGTIYYFLPKVLGTPVRSYALSMLGFWTLAFFYGQVGAHHLIGGPVPSWLITLSTVQSMMMIIPVLAFSVNMYLTMKGRMRALLHSPTLRFVAFGGLAYMASSVQGSFEALRSVNTITHFTQYTVGHAHLGMYAFIAMALFGGIYFIMPRVMGREWPYPRLILAHFWLAVIGVSIYFVSLTIGGWLQGLAMLDAARPFMDSVTVTLPYLKARSVGGLLMTLGHFVFGAHFIAMVLGLGPARESPPVFRDLDAGHA
ncbi:MAG: cbb3-type cytochrome c oxidase subunit I [Usitatibacter sp.]